MLESLREYALERLALHSKEWTVLKRRHAKYFMALAEAAELRLDGQ
jgi:predicted ATPase